MIHLLPKLPYAYDALEPYLDAKTMELHHTRHHKTYVENLNIFIKDESMEEDSLEEIVRNTAEHPDMLRNNAGGHYNHSLFWSILAPPDPKESGIRKPTGALAEAIDEAFDSFDHMKEDFDLTASLHFGSGWTWLSVDDEGGLFVCATHDQENPLMNEYTIRDNGIPILGLDLWEHAYYLKYYNKRNEYIKNFWHIINWPAVAGHFEAAKLTLQREKEEAEKRPFKID
ncbi:MAG: superoxide dismutase [Bacteroidota bacterium]